MLTAVWMVLGALKIGGLVLLGIVGLLLLALFLVLLVPVRYRIQGSFYGEPKAQAGVSWLCHALSVKAVYENKLVVTARILGIRVFRMEKVFGKRAEDEGEKEDESAGKEPQAGKIGQEGNDPEVGRPGPREEEPGIGRSGTKAEEPGIGRPGTKAEESGIGSLGQRAEDLEAGNLGQRAETSEAGKPGQRAEASEAGSPGQKGKDSEARSAGEKPEDAEVLEQKANPAEDRKFGRKGKNVFGKRKKREEGKKKQKTEGFSFGRICDKLKEIIQRLRDRLERIMESLHELEEKTDRLTAFLCNDANQATFRLLKRQIWALCRHVLPRKAAGRVRFGFADPFTTGQVLAYISPFYGLYARHVQVIPVFDEPVMEGEGMLKGRIRMGTVLLIGLRMLFDRNFRALLRKHLRA